MARCITRGVHPKAGRAPRVEKQAAGELNMTTRQATATHEVPSLWSVNPESLADAGLAFRAWLEYNGRVQAQAAKFLSERLAKDTAAMMRLGGCKSPVDAIGVQLEFVTTACADYLEERRRMAEIASGMAAEGVAGALEAKRDTGRNPTRPAARRSASH
jgi:phasin protein